MPYSPMGAQPLGFAPLQPFVVYQWQAYVQLGDGHQSMPGMHRVAAPSATLSRGGAFYYSVCCSPTIPFIWWAYSLGGLAESHPIPLPPLHDGEGSSFPGLVPSNDTVNSESVMGIKNSIYIYIYIYIGEHVKSYVAYCISIHVKVSPCMLKQSKSQI